GRSAPSADRILFENPNRRRIERLFWMDGLLAQRGAPDGGYPLDERRMALWSILKWKVQPDDEIAHLEVPAQIRQTGDLARHHEGLDLSFQSVTLLAATAFRSAFGEALDLHVADAVGDPLRRVRLARAEKDLCRRLRQHRFGVVPISGL